MGILIRREFKMLKLEDFQAAKKRVDEVILPTHLIHSEAFSEESGNDVYIKPENLQKTGAFKIRGAYNKIMNIFCHFSTPCTSSTFRCYHYTSFYFFFCLKFVSFSSFLLYKIDYFLSY